jgi:hypothetical protein
MQTTEPRLKPISDTALPSLKFDFNKKEAKISPDILA